MVASAGQRRLSEAVVALVVFAGRGQRSLLVFHVADFVVAAALVVVLFAHVVQVDVVAMVVFAVELYNNVFSYLEI